MSLPAGLSASPVAVWLRIVLAVGCVSAAMLETSDGIYGADWATIPMLLLACIVLSIDAALIRVKAAIVQANARVAKNPPAASCCNCKCRDAA